jgi:hypothetical protein
VFSTHHNTDSGNDAVYPDLIASLPNGLTTLQNFISNAIRSSMIHDKDEFTASPESEI